ncbi:MAG TPA: hypothetical protein VEL28_20335 [Candidatus Binatia bacterium]|nr:hypothetical protein [Candidatus Binatia bacterium]
MIESCRRGLFVVALLMSLLPVPAIAGGLCQSYDVQEDWSETSNPNGPWSYREGTNALPHVEAWQRTIGGWSEFQPGWAESEDSNNRLPFFFKSNGKATFDRDFLKDDIVVHTWDGTNGQGNGHAELVWTSPFDGVVTISGAAWMGRDIGRSVNWQLLHDATLLSQGAIASGDIYSRGAPFSLENGSGGAAAVQDIAVSTGDEIRLRLETSSQAGDFVGIRMQVECDSITSTTTTTVPLGDCGDPLFVFRPDSDAGTAAAINASDALYVLRTAVGTVECELCVCDVNDSGNVTATDSLIVLRNAVGQSADLDCPACE